MNQTQPFTMIDLFAGCGGLSLGLEQAGFQSHFVNELNTDAMASYLKNRNHILGGMEFNKNKDLREYDIENLLKETRFTKLKEDLRNIGLVVGEKIDQNSLDLVCGGPPCQGYSGIGHRRSYSVDRQEIPSNELYKQMSRFIHKTRPKIFLFENVRGLMTAKWSDLGSKGDIWRDVKQNYRSLGTRCGYTVKFDLVYAKDYGVPQNRPRILMVGIRNDVIRDCDSSLLDPNAHTESAIACSFLPAGNAFPYPNIQDVLGDLVDPAIAEILESGDYPKGVFSSQVYHSDPEGPVQEYYRLGRGGECSKIGDKVTDQQYSKHSRQIVKKFRHMIDHGCIPDEFKTKKFSQKVLPPQWDLKGPTITTTSLPDDYVHYQQPRSLTVREWARLQTFPDWYQFCGKRTTGGLRRAGNPQEEEYQREAPKYTQIGNAVPVRLAKLVGHHFRKILESYRSVK
ncbi:MAG: DNA cytosine methyltransferase [Rubripirellula sp.]